MDNTKYLMRSSDNHPPLKGHRFLVYNKKRYAIKASVRWRCSLSTHMYSNVAAYTYTRCQIELQLWKRLFALSRVPEMSRVGLHLARWTRGSRGEDREAPLSPPLWKRKIAKVAYDVLWYHNACPARAHAARRNSFAFDVPCATS
jgi:hypothetical protein